MRPVYHQTDNRIDAHIFVSFMSYCLFVTLKHKAKQTAPGLIARAILEKFSTMQMVDAHLPTTDGRHLLLQRYTQPDTVIKSFYWHSFASGYLNNHRPGSQSIRWIPEKPHKNL